MNALAADSSHFDSEGTQLAWAVLPGTTFSADAKDKKDLSKSKPKPKAAPAVTTTPTPVAPAKPSVTPAPKLIEAPAPKPIEAPVQFPVTQPRQPSAVIPLPAAVAKPAPLPATKPEQPVAVKPRQHSAARSTQAFAWLIGLGMDFGGEELGKLYYTDGSSAAVKANNGIALNVGGIVQNGDSHEFSTQITLGYKYGGQRGSGGDVTWSAIPLEIIEDYRSGDLHMGLGISYQIRPQLSVNLPASAYVDKYNNALGFIAQIGWLPWGEHFSIDLRYTSIKFQLSDVAGAPAVDGSVAGIHTSYRF